MSGIIASAVQGGLSIANSAINNQNQNNINLFNAQQNRQNMMMQNAYSASAEADARAYNSPLEQMKRLTSAGINAFTAQDMISSNEGSAANVAAAPPSNAVASQVNLDFSALADSLMKIDEMHFTNSQNRQAARETLEQLLTNIDNQVKMQGIEIEERKRAQAEQIRSDLERQNIQNDWQTEEYKKDRELQREQLYTNNKFNYANAMMSNKTQRDIVDKQISFNKWNATEQRRWQSSENKENRFLQNLTTEESNGLDLGLIKFIYQKRKSGGNFYRGSMEEYFQRIKDFYNIE